MVGTCTITTSPSLQKYNVHAQSQEYIAPHEEVV
jgi:hypothetical protein